MIKWALLLALGGSMIEVRRASDRGHTRLDWLSSYHTFSFGEYHDPLHAGFRTLRVINDDRVRPEAGFSPHSHRDMEILSYVLEGSLEHKDTMGNHSVIRRGELQLMSAGSGIQHSEFNPSERETAHFLQIWIMPEKKGLTPSYQQKLFHERERKNQAQLVVSHDGREGSLRIHQDANIYLAHLDEGAELTWSVQSGRGIWIQVTRGEVTIEGVQLSAGDGISIEKEKEILISGKSNGEFFIFDLGKK